MSTFPTSIWSFNLLLYGLQVKAVHTVPHSKILTNGTNSDSLYMWPHACVSSPWMYLQCISTLTLTSSSNDSRWVVTQLAIRWEDLISLACIKELCKGNFKIRYGLEIQAQLKGKLLLIKRTSVDKVFKAKTHFKF